MRNKEGYKEAMKPRNAELRGELTRDFEGYMGVNLIG